MSKKFLIAIALFVGLGSTMNAQKFAYVDSQYILEKMPEYKEAQKKLDDLSASWQKEVETKYQEIDKLYKDYQKEQILLPEDMKIKRQEEIATKEKEVKDFQKSKFGVSGELFTKRQEWIKPIQEKIYKAIKEIAETGSYTFVFDKANNANILYADPKNDKTEAVIKKLSIN
jgi:outer membrane protein